MRKQAEKPTQRANLKKKERKEKEGEKPAILKHLLVSFAPPGEEKFNRNPRGTLVLVKRSELEAGGLAGREWAAEG